jgi:hypothetical protein
MARADERYTPPDLTQIDISKPEALRYWARTLETDENRVRQAVRKAGPLLEDVKRELGSYGPG